jgi:hypothetical protein
MKPEVPPAAAPPARSPNAQPENQAAREPTTPTPAGLPTSARQRRLPSLLIVMLVVYGLWLGWLAYVALINVRAGNQ